MADYRRDLAELDARTRAVACACCSTSGRRWNRRLQSLPVSGVVRRPTLLDLGVDEPPPAVPVNARVLAAVGLGPRPSGRER